MNPENEKSNKKVDGTPETLEKVMQIVEVKSWLILSAIIILMAATAIWIFFGTIQVREDMRGILSRSGEIINIYSPEEQILSDISIESEDSVEKGQVVARLDQSDLVGNINKMIKENAPVTEIELARAELNRRSKIITPEEGRVLDVFVRSGDYLDKGTKIATISKGSSKNEHMDCILYIPFHKIQKIKKGMNVVVCPDFADKSVYGNMIGKVAFIGSYPVTFQKVYDRVGNEELATALLGDQSCYEVTVNLVMSEETSTGYKWSTSLGPSKKIGNLELCDVSVITSQSSPFNLFFSRD